MADGNIYPIFDQLVQKEERELFLNQRAKVFWFTGLSGSGKSTIAKGVERQLFNEGYLIQVIDGDNVRDGLCGNLSFSLEDRMENIRRVSELAKLYVQSGIVTLCSFISPTRNIRSMAREVIGQDDFKEIFVNTPLSLCENRDVKGLYKRARAGEIKGFTGIDSPYEPPALSDLEIRTEKETIEQSIDKTSCFVRSWIERI